MTNELRIICTGSATFDTIFRLAELPRGAGKFLPLEIFQIAHGMASSAAATIAKLGGGAMLFARVGSDETGKRIITDLMDAGVDCRFIHLVEGAQSPLCTVLVDNVGERLIVPYYDPKLGTDTDWLPIDEIKKCAAVLVDVRWPQGSAAVLKAAKALGIFAVLDADVGPYSAYELLIPLSTHIVFSEPAALLYSGATNPVDAVAKIGPECDAFVAVTIGEGGCLWFDRDSHSVMQLRPPKVHVVDTLAAGDVFHGAFTFALAQKKKLVDCIRFANVAAALKCQTFGGRIGAPRLDEVETMLALIGSVPVKQVFKCS